MSDYWVKRALERLRRADLLADSYEAKIFRLYQESFDELNGELKALFQHYAEQGALTPIEAAEYLRAPVTRAQADAIMQKLAEVEDPDIRRRLLARANSAQVSARMKRIQAMQENIKAECAKIADKEITLHQEAARKIGADAYYRTAFDVQQGVNAAIPFAQMTIEKIDAVLSERWAGDNYSARVWQNAEAMAQKLGELVRTNVAAGRPWESCIGEMAQYMTSPDQGGYYAAARLLRTETMHVYNEMSAEASSALGAERYRYIAILDLKTSETCRLHDGLIDPDTGEPYTYANRKPGKNFPPLHPWCRSIEAPYIDEETLEGMTRPARDPVTGEIVQVPATMTYPEWYKEHVEGNPQAKLNERMTKNTPSDRKQWQRYREVLGKTAPKDLAAFQRMKYSSPDEWRSLQAKFRRMHLGAEGAQEQIHPAGRIDRSRFAVIEPEITTDEVVITDERLNHIRQRHPGDYEAYGDHIPVVLNNPDAILRDSRRATAVMIKSVAANDSKIGLRLTLRLHTPQDHAGYKNSILSFQHVRSSEFRRLIAKETVIYKREGL